MWTPNPAKIVTAEMKAAAAQDELLASFRSAIQAHIDDTARSRHYDNGNSIAGYVASTHPAWAEEAQAFVAWRDEVWMNAYDKLDEVVSGRRAVPAIEEIIVELPAIVWPLN